MKTNKELEQKINDFPGNLSDLAKQLMKDIDSSNLSNSQIEERIKQEIRELVLEEINR